MSKNIQFPNRKNFTLFLITVLLAGVALIVSPVHAATITVNSTLDVIDDDGQCTLREAITAANTDTASGSSPGECPAGSGADTITLPAGTYTLIIEGSSEHLNETGDLDIRSAITINGDGAANTIIQAGSDSSNSTNGNDRVFHVVDSGDALTLNNVTARYGQTSGGGAYNAGTLAINNSVISNNSGTYGGGIYNIEGTLAINNSVISYNSSAAKGGGVYANGGTATIQNSTIASNSAIISGGGVYANVGKVIIQNSTLANNKASTGAGGGVYINEATATIQNSTISGNSASTPGGGVNQYHGALRVAHSTITNNSTGLGGGGIETTSGVNLINTVVAGNRGGVHNVNDCQGLITSQGYNLVGVGTGCPSGGTGDQTTGDPRLGPLQDNGGPTQTHALLPDSPAVEVIPNGANGCGTFFASDQRGAVRPHGGLCDVGAYESPYILWDGGGADQYTSTALNWSSDTTPVVTDVPVFRSISSKDATVDSDLAVMGWIMDTSYSGVISQGSSILTVNGDWNQSGGTFNGGGGALDIEGTFNLSGGTFTAPTGLMSVGGGFHHSNGSFDPNGGRVVLDNTSDQTLATTTTFNDLVLNDGLLGYWKLDEGTGTTAADSSGYNYDGTLNRSPAWSTDAPAAMDFHDPYTLQFDRTDADYVSIPRTTHIDNLQQLSLSTWVNLGSMPTGSGYTYMRFITLGNEKAVLRYVDLDGTGKLQFFMNIGGSIRSVAVDHAWQTESWYHVAGTYDGITMRLYLNGVEQGSYSKSGTVATGNGIYLSWSGGDATLDGLMDDVRVYNRALSSTQIGDMADGKHPTTSQATTSLASALDVNGDLTLNSGTLDVSPAQAGYWKFDEESGATAGDSSGNGNDGTLNGDPIWTTTVAPTNFTNSHALDFDGTDDYVAINGVADDVSGDVAIAFWVKAPSGSGNRTMVAVNTTGKGNVMFLSLRNDDAYWVYDAGSLAWEGDTNTVVADGTWHHLAYTSDGTIGRLYVDGVQKSTHTPNYALSSGDLWSLAQEWDSGGNSDFLTGILDDVRIYDHVLSADDIQTLAEGDGNEVYKSINLAGDFTRNGGVFEPGGGSVTFDGSGSQALDSDAITLYDMTVEAGTTVDLGPKTVLTVAGTLANNGSLKQTKDVNGSHTAFLNIKDTEGADRYQGVEIDPGAGDMGSTAVTVSGNQLCSTATRGVLRCFELEPTSPHTALVRFYYTDAERNGQDNSTLNIYHWNDAGSAWDPEVGTYARGGIDEGQWVQVTDVDEYSPFALANEAPIVPLVAGFEANPTKGVAPLAVTFTNTTSGGYSTSLWDFGDGQTSGEQHPTHVYTITGTYTVSLDVSGLGGSDTLTRTNYITATVPAPAAAFTGDPTNGIAPLPVQFSDESTGDIDTWLWQFGDGDTSADPHPTHIYSSGTYTVSLEVSGPGGSDTLTRTNYITVTEPEPVAAFSSDLNEGPAPLEVQFSDESTGAINTWLWQFGDGDTSPEQHPAHIYTSTGVYTMSLTVDGPDGSDTLTLMNYITVMGPAMYRVNLPLVIQGQSGDD